MKDLKWKSKYSIGIEEVDYQHQYFIKLIERLQHESEQDHHEDYLHRLIEELSLYAQFHFASEENIMYLYKYPQLEEHADLHAQLIDDLTTYTSVTTLSAEKLNHLIDFLMDWFLSHTAKEDQEIANFLKKNQLSEETK